MKKRFRWVLGDGNSITIGVDKWLRTLNDFCVNSITTSDLAKQSKVHEFFKDNGREWDVDKVNLHFSPEDAAAIVNTRIPQGCTRDRIAWVHTSNGQYTVKSAYFQWFRTQNTGEGTSTSVGWKRLWRLPIPHKIRVFLWRLCRNTIPVRYRLRGRGVPVTISCPLCGGEVEHLRHLFFECSFSKECWQLVGLNFEAHDMEYVSDWLVSFLATGPLQEIVTLSAVLWGIWYARNKYVFENKSMPPGVVKSWCLKQVGDWQAANVKQNTNHIQRNNPDRSVHKWKKPREGQLKINVDASVVEGQNSFAVGMVIRDHLGQFLAGKTLKYAGSVSIIEDESTGILEAILWVREKTEGTVLVESDSLLSVTAIKQHQSNLLELGAWRSGSAMWRAVRQ